MPKSYIEVAEQLNDILDRSGENIVTLPWVDAYTITQTKRWSETRTNGIIDAAFEQYDIIVTSGYAGIFIMKDVNFSPVSA